ncbi:hypothetical protein H0H92_006181 [Tricholoma furcatifolium]|nr:hypothetical protein H0H92_006181 [Tricholoma furcatifolium]
MPSFRTLFLLAVTVFAAVSSASPVEVVNEVSQPAAEAYGVRAVDVPSTVHVDTFAAPALEERAGELVALPLLISTCQQSLTTVQANVNVAISTGIFTVAIATPFLTAITTALATLVAGCQLLVGLDITVIIGGTVTIQALATIGVGLIAILNLVINIVLSIFNAVGSAGLVAVLNIVIGAGGIAQVQFLTHATVILTNY